MKQPNTSSPLLRFAWLSVGAASATILLKGSAFLLTNSVGLLSDALESIVNLIGAVMMLVMLTIAARPPDEDHSYGHDKAEYFASGVEGILVLAAAVGIMISASGRLISPQPLEKIGTGLIISTAASIINLVTARILLQASSRFHSIALEADSKHLMTDVWTSVGVVGGLGAAALTGWEILDPIIAILVALNILRTGWELLRRTISGLMDSTLPADEITGIKDVLNAYEKDGILYHALRTRQAGRRRFVSMHILAPGDWTLQQGHHLLEEIEGRIQASLPGIIVFTHIEPLEDETSWQDTHLDPVDPTGAWLEP